MSTRHLGESVESPQKLCLCGHPAERHLYGTGSCTVASRRLDAKGKPTTSWDYCECREYRPRVL